MTHRPRAPWRILGQPYLCLAFALLAGRPAAAQQCDAAHRSDRLFVFLDCTVSGCDRDFFMTELPFMTWIREPARADVAVLVTAQATGAGGLVYTLTFRGAQAHGGRADTVTRAIPPGASDDERRRTLSRALMLSLVRYMPDALAARLRVVLDGPVPRKQDSGPGTDPWNSWVFKVGGAMNLAIEQRTHTRSFSGNLEARRVTEGWKISLAADGASYASRFALSDGSTLAFHQQSYRIQTRFARALTGHWSAGWSTALGRSDYRNQRLTLQGAPAIEYNVYPWPEAAHRQLTLGYEAGTTYSRYGEETIYGKRHEAQPFHEFVAAAAVRQPWGSLNATLRVQQPIRELAHYNLTGLLDTSLRLTGGLALSLYVSGEWVRYQPYLPRGTLSDEEILAGQRALGTSYRVASYVGLTYTFGSIFTAVVNPRLDGMAD